MSPVLTWMPWHAQGQSVEAAQLPAHNVWSGAPPLEAVMPPKASDVSLALTRVPRHAQGQSAEEARARRDHLAKMRSLLFHQEAKLKHLAKIKSKDYHRRAQKAARAKVASVCPPEHGTQIVLMSDRITLFQEYLATWAACTRHVSCL